MAADPIARIQNLIQLSASENENEARNAAYLACKLLREHNVELRLPTQAPSKSPPKPKGRPRKRPRKTPNDQATYVEFEGSLYDFEKFIRGVKKT